MINLPVSSLTTNLILGIDIFHQLGQVLPQPLWVTFVCLGNLFDECLLRLVNENH